MKVANCKGDFEIQSWKQLEQQIKESSSYPYDDIWLSGETEYPCLSILINGNSAKHRKNQLVLNGENYNNWAGGI